MRQRGHRSEEVGLGKQQRGKIVPERGRKEQRRSEEEQKEIGRGVKEINGI